MPFSDYCICHCFRHFWHFSSFTIYTQFSKYALSSLISHFAHLYIFLCYFSALFGYFLFCNKFKIFSVKYNAISKFAILALLTFFNWCICPHFRHFRSFLLFCHICPIFEIFPIQSTLFLFYRFRLKVFKIFEIEALKILSKTYKISQNLLVTVFKSTKSCKI